MVSVIIELGSIICVYVQNSVYLKFKKRLMC